MHRLSILFLSLFASFSAQNCTASPSTPPPPAHSRLPAVIRRAVESRHQTIPRSASGCNAFSGHFYQPGQTDWAVLSADDTTTAFLIFVAGRADSVQVLSTDSAHPCRPDSLCACAFTLLPRRSVQYFIDHARQDADPGTAPPAVTSALHDGIEEWVGEGLSVIHYNDRGHWVTISGMD